MATKPYLGQRLSYDEFCCTVRYIGPVEGTAGEWLGVEWDERERGKHSGEYKDKKYFDCKLPNTGSFVRPSREPQHPISFLEGLKRKYTTANDPTGPHAVVSISATKVMEEVGFDKILEKLSQLKELKIVLVDGLQIARADDVDAIRETCPKIEELDLSRNLFQDLQSVAQICSALPNLKKLRINGNRFSSLEINLPEGQESPFKNVISLEISSTFISWEETTQLLTHFPKIAILESSLNNISTIPASISLPPTIHTLNLERNAFTSFTPLLSLASLTHITTLILADNQISTILSHQNTTTPPPIFTSQTHLDLSFNHLPTLPTLDALPPLFPNLTSIRVSHNPFCTLLPTEEAHMLTIARFPPTVTLLNYSVITEMERQNADMYYLSRIASELAAAPEEKEAAILEQHRRWAELCELHGPPRIDRATGQRTRNLGSKLISLELVLVENPDTVPLVKRIPGVVSVGMLKGLVGRMVGIEPLRVRMELVAEGEEVGGVVLEDPGKEVGYYVERSRGRVLVRRDAEGGSGGGGVYGGTSEDLFAGASSG